jgi:gas vesicle protein
MHPFLKGFLVGLALGAAAGLLMTPHKGPENRDSVRQRFQQAVAAGKKAAQEQDDLLRTRFRERIGRREEKESSQS